MSINGPHVWVVLGNIDYETYQQLLGIYGTELEANGAADRQRRRGHWNRLNVVEVEVGKPFGDGV